MGADYFEVKWRGGRIAIAAGQRWTPIVSDKRSCMNATEPRTVIALDQENCRVTFTCRGHRKTTDVASFQHWIYNRRAVLDIETAAPTWRVPKEPR